MRHYKEFYMLQFYFAFIQLPPMSTLSVIFSLKAITNNFCVIIIMDLMPFMPLDSIIIESRTLCIPDSQPISFKYTFFCTSFTDSFLCNLPSAFYCLLLCLIFPAGLGIDGLVECPTYLGFLFIVDFYHLATVFFGLTTFFLIACKSLFLLIS